MCRGLPIAHNRISPHDYACLLLFASLPLGLELTPTLEAMWQKVASKRIHVVIFDYVQLVNPDSDFKGSNKGEQVLGTFKQFCIRYGLVGIMTSQVTKEATEKV